MKSKNDNIPDQIEESDEDETGMGSYAAESKPGGRQKRNKRRSSANWWARGSLTASEVYKEREKFEEAEEHKLELKNIKRKERDAKNAANVLARKARGAEILKTGKSFSKLNVEQLKDVLAVCEIYPNRKPPTPYAKGRQGLLKQLLNSFTCDIDKMPLGASSALSEGGVEIVPEDDCVSSSSQ